VLAQLGVGDNQRAQLGGFDQQRFAVGLGDPVDKCRLAGKLRHLILLIHPCGGSRASA
jgi:hypothetical protein